MASVKKVFDKLDEEGKVTSKHKGGSFKPPSCFALKNGSISSLQRRSKRSEAVF